MKLFLQYLKQRRQFCAVMGLFFTIFLVTFLLYRLPLAAVIYPAALCALTGLVLAVLDFRRVAGRHEVMQRIRTMTDVIEHTLPEAESIEDADYQEIIRLLSKEHKTYCTNANRAYADMVDYYTVWAHQIKTPIASMRLNLQNEDSPQARKMKGDLFRIEQYVEMVLTFLRLNSESTDYVIKEYDLDHIVRQVVKKFSHEFIGRKLRLNYEPLNTAVITDEKWLGFVIEQLLSNALKYTREGGITISIDGEKKLSIADTGMGIAASDLPRIFENGYTGFNGRSDKRASGIGLYLCRRICNNLGHGISAQSTVGEGTTIIIDLAQKTLEVE